MEAQGEEGGRFCLLEELRVVSIWPNTQAQSGNPRPKSIRFETRRRRELDALGSDVRRSSGGCGKSMLPPNGQVATTPRRCYRATEAPGRRRFISHAPIHRVRRPRRSNFTGSCRHLTDQKHCHVLLVLAVLSQGLILWIHLLIPSCYAAPWTCTSGNHSTRRRACGCMRKVVTFVSYIARLVDRDSCDFSCLFLLSRQAFPLTAFFAPGRWVTDYS